MLVDDGNITGAATGVKINLGQQTTLTKNGQVFSFSTPQAGLHGTLEAVNDTGDNQNITVGFMIPGQFLPKPALFFDNIRALSCRDAIQAPPIWVHDLTALEQSTTWNLTRDPAIWTLHITRA
ncbi:hypothetical protein EDB19DRAFT_1752674 [Suillus lakei]|nr:hypothetical protein EDB19DRAFT_1752674 [Suillus lakei]